MEIGRNNDMTNASSKFFDWLFRNFHLSFLEEILTAIISLRTDSNDAEKANIYF